MDKPPTAYNGIKYPVAVIGFAVIVVPSKVSVLVPANTPALLYCISVSEPAGEAVPKSEPVNDVAVKEPEMFTVFAVKSPFISGTPEPEAIYNLLLS